MEITIRGHRCVYDCIGEGSCLTLLHSVGLSTREGWRYQIEPLTEHFRVLAFDFRGLGQSEPGDMPLGVATFAGDLEALLQGLGIARTALMGVSLGGFVAQEFTLMRPDMVSALILVSTASRIHPANAARRQKRNEEIRKNGMAAAVDNQIKNHFPESFSRENPRIIDWYRSHYVANDPDSYIAIMNDLGRFDSTDRIGGIRCPTLIVAGDEDAGSVAGSRPLESAAALHRLIPGSILEVITGANHYPHIDHPEIFNTKTVHFLTGPGTAARTPADRGVT